VGGRRKRGRKTTSPAAYPTTAGRGPAQLALALAADVLGDDEAALGVYQRLKFRVVGRLSEGGWTLTETELADAIRALVEPEGA
jgi:hypothetical protein